MNRFLSRKHKKIVILITASVAIAAFLIWLTVSANSLKIDDGYRRIIGVSQFSAETVRQNAFKQSATEAVAKHSDVNVLFANADTVWEKQISQIESLIMQKIDVLIVEAPDFVPLEASLQKARDQHVTLALIGDPDTDTQCDMLIAIDYFAMGKSAGEYFLSLDNPPSNILEIQGIPRNRHTIQMQSGFRSAIENSGSRINFVIAGYDSAIIAKQRAVDSRIAQANPPIDGIFIHDEEMASDVVQMLPDIPAVAIGVTGQIIQISPQIALVLSSSGGSEAIELALELPDKKAGIPREHTLPVGLVLPAEESSK